ncbi:helix-turn-helix domain-containing protein [Leucobacter sp. CSA2]|uniref:Helix-turn-helix domain-containing protein n=1 Tax=Leucobacter edaphi TaxID=2796472 RepID=A0A934UXH8_9MICO|nr:PucR family transcriptional regulator [Leucobacter edaphi]MBK0422030.1 helix-turn-helix domain-containing protein [Leucobacter edaphi]
MTLDLRAVVRALGGECVSHRVPGHAPIDGVAHLDEYVFDGSADFATLITGPVDQLRERLLAGGETAEITARAVFVTGADGPELRTLLAAHEMTGILGAGHVRRAGGPHPSGSAAGAVAVRTSVDAQAALHARLVAMIANDQAASDRLVLTGTKVLTQVARRGGTTAVIAELAHRVDGWAVLMDANGQVIATAGAGQLHIDDAVAVALGRPVRVRHDGLQVHQVGTDRDRTGYLVIASRSSVRSRNRDLASQAAALFDLLLRTHDPSRSEHLGREALLGILNGGGSAAAELLHRWGVLDRSLTAFQLATRTRTIDLERALSRWLDEIGAEHIYALDGARVRGFVPDALAEELAERVAAFTPLGAGSLHLGLGLPAPAELLERSALQAQLALDTALEDGTGVLRYAELPSVSLVIEALPREASAQLAAALDGLRDPSGAHGELAETLLVYLTTNGAHRASAARLGIHRQTLVSRLRRIEALTGFSVDRPDDRAAIWLALRALGISSAAAAPM